ncbi:hypothetical protein FFWV33_16125 [Flavobacterium faecale]|uniref:Uncharacterized protein n=1 Tax=Flavobacterium faecale TaxID=1355330 RepID=A0A2S1LGQ5_9FLAO|nr:hypothetical protein [Flavobacterium faecale]AWG22945.1 hypothetical protein FFWV33_16125 [Flavobacterium faecale]
MTINNYDELVLFAESNKLTNEQLAELIKICLGIFTIIEYESNVLLDLKEYWFKFGHLAKNERPMFLFQTQRDFNINDIYKIPELKEIIDKLEEDY